MKKLKLTALIGLPLLALCITAAAVASRQDCPGTKFCPLTGEVICVDKCPQDCCAPVTDAP